MSHPPVFYRHMRVVIVVVHVNNFLILDKTRTAVAVLTKRLTGSRVNGDGQNEVKCLSHGVMWIPR